MKENLKTKTEKSEIKTGFYHVPKHCVGCCYRRGMYSRISGCHYMLDTGNERGCAPENCDKKRIDKSYIPPCFTNNDDKLVDWD
ncbi:MAG: hypothetical protein GX896_09030 [Clostridiales bacterium]|nr:hypothetical protein [Clostridiales bacterium]